MDTAINVFPPSKKIKLIGKKKFTTAAFYFENEIFLVIVVFSAISDRVCLSCKVQIALLKVDGALITVFAEYFDFENIFSLWIDSKALRVYGKKQLCHIFCW